LIKFYLEENARVVDIFIIIVEISSFSPNLSSSA
jgi:hypothetical protein